MKCLVFDIWGDFAHYRKFYTTSSPLTFSFPPRTAIVGMIAALIGIDKDEYLKCFSKKESNIALKLINSVKKGRLSYNLIDTKTAKMMSKIQNRTQVTFEVLKDCGYRIYFTHNDEKVYSKVKDYLKNHKSYYTLSLGLSEYIANFKFVDEVSLKEKYSKDYVYINSVLPFNEDMLIDFEVDKEYFKDTVPSEMNENREVTEYTKVIYERNCKSIKCVLDKFYKVEEGDNIVFL